MTRVCVFVDGENLRHAITDLFSPALFDKRDYLPSGARWATFFDHLVSEATGAEGRRIRAYWYVINSVDPQPFTLKPTDRTAQSFDEWLLRNERLLRRMHKWDEFQGEDKYERLNQAHTSMWNERTRIKNRFEGFHVVQDAIALAHRAVEFRRSGGIRYNLLTQELGDEKTVDVNLAVDMVLLRDNYDMALIVSGDQDYVPAVQAAKNFGKHVVNVGFNTRTGGLLPGGAKRLNERTDWSIAVPYEQFRDFLGLPAATAAQ